MNSFFQKSFNLVIWLVKLAFFFLLVKIATNIYNYIPESIITDYLISINYLSTVLVVFFIVIVIGIILVEIYLRIKNDLLFNLLKSISQTLTLRRFLSQMSTQETSDLVNTVKHQVYNPVNHHFNKAIKKTLVDVKKKKIDILINVPKTQQSQKIFNDLKDQILDEISNLNPNYYFSGVERKGGYYTIKGSLR